jgi:hypothetical protein
MTDYGQKSRAQMMARYQLERRQRKIRRIYFHALDYAGFICWCMAGIMTAACAIFVLWHR